MFLVRECDDPGQQLCPGGPYQAFRDAHTDDEIARAGKLFTDALAINPNDVTAMNGAAEILLRSGQYGDGETLVRRALQIDPNDPRVLSQLSEILDYAADTRSGNAENLRTPKTWTSFVPGFVVWNTRYPSQNELDQADRLDEVANQLWGEASDRLAAAVKARAGTPDGFYYQGLIDTRAGNADAVISDYQNATKLAPTATQYRRALIKAYARYNQRDLAATEQETYTLQRQTTANVHFALAWNDLDRTAYSSMEKDLDGAFAIDSADVRNGLYRGVMAQAHRRARDAVKWYQVGLAMNEANLRLDGLSAVADAKTPLPAFTAAMPVVVKLRIAGRQRGLKAIDAEMATLNDALSIIDRVPKKQWTDAWANAVVPNPLDTKAHEPPTIDFLWASAKVMAGNTLIVLHKYDDATDQFAAVASVPRRGGPVSNFLPDKQTLDPHWVADANATRMHWAKNDPDSTRRPHWLASALTFTILNDNEKRTIAVIQAGIDGARNRQYQTEHMKNSIENLPPDQRQAAEQWEQQHPVNGAAPARNDPPGWPSGPSAPSAPKNPSSPAPESDDNR
jgi:tetratricopeptide (TPR) repeat protein